VKLATLKVLRPYQLEKMKELKGIYDIYPNDQRAFLQMPVGTGKTFTALSFAIAQLKGEAQKSVVWVVHQCGLADQSAGDFRDDFENQGGIISKDLKKGSIGTITFYFMTWQTLRESINRDKMKSHDMLIVDEAHFGSSNTKAGKNGEHMSFKKIFQSKLFRKHLYVSATPWDLNSEVFPGMLTDDKRNIRKDRAAILSMREAKRLNELADVTFNIFHSADTLELKRLEDDDQDEVKATDTKTLAKKSSDKRIDFSHARTKKSLRQAVVQSTIEGYLRLEGGKDGKSLPPTIIYCHGIANDPRSVTEVMKAIKLTCKALWGAKYNTEKSLVSCAHSQMTKGDEGTATGVLNDFRSGKIKILCVANMAQEGFNYPDLEVAIDMCPSLDNIRRRIQRIGRVIRKKSNGCSARYYYADTITNYIRIQGARHQVNDDSKDQIEQEISEYDQMHGIIKAVDGELVSVVANAKVAVAQINAQDEASDDTIVNSPYLGTDQVILAGIPKSPVGDAEGVELFRKEKKIAIQRTRVGFVISDAYLSASGVSAKVRTTKLSDMLERSRVDIPFDELTVEQLIEAYHGNIKNVA
jgi:superfamily II DNA or RNA helicase